MLTSHDKPVQVDEAVLERELMQKTKQELAILELAEGSGASEIAHTHNILMMGGLVVLVAVVGYVFKSNPAYCALPPLPQRCKSCESGSGWGMSSRAISPRPPNRPLQDCSPGRGLHTYDPKFGALRLVQAPFSVASRQTLLRFATFTSLFPLP